MNHSRRFVIVLLSISLSLLIVLSGSLSVFAKPPVKVTLYGVTYGTDESSAYHTMRIMPVSNNIFGVYTDGTTYHLNTQMRFYFGASTDSIESFTLSIKKLGTTLQTNSSSGLGSYAINLCNLNSAGTIIAYESIRVSTQTSYSQDDDGSDVYNWRWVSTSGARPFSVIQVTVCFQNFMISTSPVYFELLDLSVNGEETVFSAYESETLEHLENIDDAITGDPNPDFDESDLPTVPDGSTITNQAQSSINAIEFFTTYFDLGGAMQRTLGQFSDKFLVVNANDSLGHKVITYSCLFSLGAVFVIWLVNQLKRHHGGGDG